MQRPAQLKVQFLHRGFPDEFFSIARIAKFEKQKQTKARVTNFEFFFVPHFFKWAVAQETPTPFLCRVEGCAKRATWQFRAALEAVKGLFGKPSAAWIAALKPRQRCLTLQKGRGNNVPHGSFKPPWKQ